MTTAGDFENEAKRIVYPLTKRMSWRNVAEAKLVKKHIIQIQKELRVVKKQANVVKRSIAASRTVARENIDRGIGGGFVAGLFGKKVIRQVKHNMHHQQVDLTTPYDTVIRYIDSLIANAESIKNNVDAFIISH